MNHTLSIKHLITGGLLATTLLLGGCGKSEHVTKLEGILAQSESQLTSCEAKQATERVECISKLLTDTGAEWAANVNAAASDDPEATAELATAYTTFTAKASDLVQQAFN